VAEEETRASLTEFIRRFTGPTIWRLGQWSVAAIAAVSLAYFIASSDLGVRRMGTAFSNVQGLPPAPSVQPRDNGEVVRLSEALRRLTVDRDRLLDRVETLERNFDDLTGSIARNSAPPRASENTPPPPPETSAPPQVIPMSAPAVINAPPGPANGPAAPMQQSIPVPTAQEAAADDTAKNSANPATTKVDFGIDLGSAATVEGLRTLWSSAKVKHAKLLDGMRPIIALRENAKPGNVELRLVAGPLPTAAAAARLCVVIITAGTVCQPAVFDGQRLAMR
jgi:hypothetical protein